MNAQEIIDVLGGTAKVAALCEVTPGAVSQWKSDGIPAARLMFLKAVRPDVFASSKSLRPT
jgi:DNA-binding transcriptional regulator YdaS (Cro superfamily)